MQFENRNTRTFTEVDVTKVLIDKANSIDLLQIFKNYSVNMDLYNRKSCCPFIFHKNGQERSASFYYYPTTNSFYCFGCKIGGGPVDFVASSNNITKYTAALQICNQFEDKVDISEFLPVNDSNKICLEFAHCIRNFMLNHRHDTLALEYAEQICLTFDSIRDKYILESDGLESLIQKLKLKMNTYKG